VSVVCTYLCIVVGFLIILGTDAVLVVCTVESEIIHLVVLDALSVVAHVGWNSWSVVVLVWTLSVVCTIVIFLLILGADAVLVVRTVESEVIHIVVSDALSFVAHVVWNSWSVVVLVWTLSVVLGTDAGGSSMGEDLVVRNVSESNLKLALNLALFASHLASILAECSSLSVANCTSYSFLSAAYFSSRALSAAIFPSNSATSRNSFSFAVVLGLC